jgi:polyribonucleotide nucleotidyltransferase
MGLVKEGDDHVISRTSGCGGPPRRHGLQVAGTRDGITALQMDMRSRASRARSEAALEQAGGREFILDKMLAAIPSAHRAGMPTHRGSRRSRSTPSRSASSSAGRRDDPRPRVRLRCRSTLRRADDPHLPDRGHEGRRRDRRDRGSDQSPEVGDEYKNAKVVKTTQFGAFVELKKGTDGLLTCRTSALDASVTSRT